jgi:hypothetical protein
MGPIFEKEACPVTAELYQKAFPKSKLFGRPLAFRV